MPNAKCLKNLNIGVFRGGVSAEREVSLQSGDAVVKALRGRGYRATDIDIRSDETEYIRQVIEGHDIDLVFIALHGEFGEDGQLQRILDEMNVPYTGSGAEASAAAMDKRETHRILEAAGIRMPAWCEFDPAMPHAPCPIPFPVVVKPPASGSSVGVRVVNTPEEFECAAGAVRESPLLIEQYIRGRELTVGILDGKPLPVVEIVAAYGFYDYASKYEDDRTRFIVPAELDLDLYSRVQLTGKRVFEALGCRHFGRVDVLLDERNIPWVLELNSIPGFTSHSLLPLAARNAGLSFEDLCEKIIRLINII
jgi:D-alanine-D-alanine ligase